MSRFDTVKEYYDNKIWSKYLLKSAVINKWITADQYKEITGEEYKE